MSVVNEVIEYSKTTKKLNLAIELQAFVKDAVKGIRPNTLLKVGSPSYLRNQEDREIDELILQKLTSEYSFSNLVCDDRRWGAFYKSINQVPCRKNWQ